MAELAEYGYWGLLLASFLAATILPFSSEALLSILIYNGYTMETCILYASIGNWLGGMSGYLLGKAGRLDNIEKFLKFNEEKIKRYENKISKHGSILAFLCWLPVIGDLIAVALGYFKCKLLPVSSWMFLGKALRYIVWAIGTYYIIS